MRGQTCWNRDSAVTLDDIAVIRTNLLFRFLRTSLN